MEAYTFKDVNTFTGYVFPKEWYEVSPANDEDDDDNDDDDDNNYIMIRYIKLT